MRSRQWHDTSGECADGTLQLNGELTATPDANDTPVVISANLQLVGANTIEVDPGTGFGLTITGNISGSGGFTLTGGGQLTLAGSGDNTDTGVTTVDAGTLAVATGANLGISAQLKSTQAAA